MTTPHSKPNSDGQSGSPWQQEAQDKASLFADQAAQAARDRTVEEVDRSKQTASSTARDGAEALRGAADTLDQQGQQSLARTTSSMATGLADFSKKLESASADELVQDIAGLARRNPEMFILGGLGAGFLLSRFFKASGSDQP